MTRVSEEGSDISPHQM